VADVAAREEALARELAWLRRRHQELSLLSETIRDLGSTLSLREVLDRLLGPVLAHLHAEIASVATRGRALLVRDIERDPDFARRNHERYDTRSLISAPLVHLSRPCGVVNVHNERSRAPFEETDLELVEAIAGHAGAAVCEGDAAEARSLVRCADDRLYRAKAAGRDRVCTDEA